MDPPDHDRLRNLVSKAFTPRALNSMRPAIEPLVASELDRVTPQGEMDLVADLALAVPAASMCAMLGVPFEDRHRLTKLVSLVTYRLAKQAYPHLQKQAEAAIMELAVYMMGLEKNADLVRMASYAPLRYVKDGRLAAYDQKYSTRIRGGESFFRQVDREESLVHLLRVNVLKRMESAVPSFALTLGRQLADVEATLAKIEAHAESVEEIDIEDVDVDDPAFESLLVGRKVKVLLQEERAFVGTADTRDTTQLSLAVTKRDQRGHERADCGAMLGSESGPDISLEVCTADVAGSHRLQVKAFSRCAELVGSPPGQRRLARGIEHEVGRFQVRSQGGYSPLCDADCGKTAAAREINRAR